MEHGDCLIQHSLVRRCLFAATMLLGASASVAQGESADAALQKALAHRVDAAGKALDDARVHGAPEETMTAVVSFSRRLSPSRIASLIGPCNCLTLLAYRSIQDMQMSFGVTRETLLQPDSETAVAHTFAESQSSLPMAPPLQASPSETAREAKFQTKREGVVAEARAGHIVLDGILLRARLADVLALRQRAGADILAIELVGRQIPFAIPLDQYQPR